MRSSNPYLAHHQTLKGPAKKALQAALTVPRRPGIHFITPGTHIKAADDLRRQQRVAALKKAIEVKAFEAGLTGELVADLKEPVPLIEWWDQPFIQGNTYQLVAQAESDDREFPVDGSNSRELTVVDYDDRNLEMPSSFPTGIFVENVITSAIDSVVHPFNTNSPNDKNDLMETSQLIQPITPKAIVMKTYLTSQEQKKLRRLNREAARKEHQEQVQLGMIPPDEPKLRLSNLTNLLANDATAAPSKLEAQIRQAMQARKQKYLDDNEARKLTPAQASQKKRAKYEEDWTEGIQCLIFHLDNDPRVFTPEIAFKVQVNSRQNHLSGLLLILGIENEQSKQQQQQQQNSSMDVSAALSSLYRNVLIVEGGPKGIKRYRHLMLDRIKWPEGERSCRLHWQGSLSKPLIPGSKARHFEVKSISAGQHGDLEMVKCLKSLSLYDYCRLDRLA